MLPGAGTVIQEGDLVHVAVAADRIETVERILAAPPEQQEQ
jgi:hypothetical protein